MKLASPTSDLFTGNKGVVKSLIFVARVACSLNFLGGQLEDESNLKHKVKKSLEVLEAAAVEKTPGKPRGRKLKAILEEEVDEDLYEKEVDDNASETRSVDLNLNRILETAEGLKIRIKIDGDGLLDMTPIASNVSAEGLEGEKRRRYKNDDGDDGKLKKRRPSKKRLKKKRRRVSVESNAGYADPSLTSAAFMRRFDELEQYFEGGARAVQQLRIDFLKKAEQDKAAMDDKIWENEAGYDSETNLSARSRVMDQRHLVLDNELVNVVRGHEGVRVLAGVVEEELDDVSSLGNISNNTFHSYEEVAKLVRGTIADGVFPDVKYIKSEKLLYKVMKCLVDQLPISNFGLTRDLFYKLYGPEVEKTLKECRLNAQEKMKAAVFSKSCS
jgi:hypothetical protein